MAEYRELHLTELAAPSILARASIEEGPLEELAASIRLVGVLHPLIVVPNGGVFEIVDGHRRYLAAQRASLLRVPCAIYPEEGIAKEAAKLHSNLFREDLTAADEAYYFAELIEKYDLTEAALCQMVRRPTEYIYARLDLLKGDPEVLAAVTQRKLTFSAAKELNKCGDETHRRYLLKQAIDAGASARVVQSWVQQWRLSLVPAPQPGESPESPLPAAAPPVDPLTCFFCGGNRDPYNLRVIYVHTWELEAMQRQMARAAQG